MFRLSRRLGVVVALLLALAAPPAGPAWADDDLWTLTPLVDCVTFDPGTSLLTAHFGYANLNSSSVQIAVGPMNEMIPVYDAGQPTTFLPGVHHDVFTASTHTNNPDVEAPVVVWMLEGYSATAPNDPSLYCVQEPTDASLTMPATLATTVGTDAMLTGTVTDPAAPSAGSGIFGNLVYDLPAGLVPGTIPPDGPCTASGSQVTCAMTPGSSTAVPVRAAAPGSYSVTGTYVSTRHGDPVPGNNLATTTVLVSGAPVATTGLAGAVTAAAATLTGTVDPAGADTTAIFTYWPDGHPELAQTAGTSGPGGGFGPAPVEAPVTGLNPGTTYDFTLAATNAHGPSTGVQRSFTTPAAISGLALAANGPGSAPTGDDVTTVFTVSNAGPEAATGIHLTVQLTGGAAGVSAAPGAGSCTVAGSPPVVSCDLGALPSGGSVDVPVTATATQAGSLVASGFVTGDGPDRSAADNIATSTVAVSAARPVNLTVSMSAPSSARKGRAFTVTFTVRNAGPGAASRVLLTLPFPSSAKVTALKAGRGTCTAGAAPACALGSFAQGGVVRVTATVVPGATGRLVLPADVHSTSPESHPADNHTQRTVLVTR